MAEMIEVFEDGAENVKKLAKKKPFVIAAAVVAVVALYVAWKKSQNVDTTGYSAIGYAGYPQTGSSGSAEGGGYYESDSSYYEEIIRENQFQTDSLLQTITEEHESQMFEMETAIGLLEERYITSEQRNAEYMAYIERQNAISKMTANSELYNNITDRATKDALHAENVAIAEAMGWEFNPDDGHYYENGVKVYTTAKAQTGQNTAYNGGNRSAVPSSSFVNNSTYNASVVDSILKQGQSNGLGFVEGVDYSLLYKQATDAGASGDTLNQIRIARENKIDSNYSGVDPNPTTRAATSVRTVDGKKYVTASDGKDMELVDYSGGIKKHDGTVEKTNVKYTTSTKRDTSRAGQVVDAGGYRHYYNEDGYLSKKVKI